MTYKKCINDPRARNRKKELTLKRFKKSKKINIVGA
jgi:hypothetical protein